MRGTGDMREIVLRHKSTNKTKYTVEVLAWASWRRGRPVWKSDNVVETIWQYLKEHHVMLTGTGWQGHGTFEITKGSMRYVMQMLADEGYATLKSNEARRYIEFGFLPDVIVTGHSAIIDTGSRVPTQEAKIVTAEPLMTPDVEKESRKLLDELPVPETPVPSYRQEELYELLKDFEELDHDEYVDYIDRLIPALKAVLDFHA